MRKSIIMSAVILLFCLTVKASDQQDESKIGISASIQNNQSDISVPIWVNEKLVIIPGFSFVSMSDVAKDFGFAFGLRYNFKNDQAVPFIKMKAGLLYFDPVKGDGWTDYLAGFALGGEYFFSKSVSVGVEGQLNFTFSDDTSIRYSNPGGTNINTATAIMATYYF